MKLLYIYSFVVLVMVSACGIVHPKKQSSTTTLTKANFPYIEKFHEGIRLKQKEEYDDALAALGYCLSVRQDDDAVFYALSEIYQVKNNIQKSLECVQKAAELDPNNTVYTQELAYLQYDTKQYDAAVKSFEKLVKKQPTNIDWLYGLAESLVKANKTEKAIEALNKTEYQAGIIPELILQKFNLYLQLNQPEKAIAEIEKGRKAFPENPQFLGVLVDYYFQTKQDAKAIEMLEKMALADPSNGRVHLGLAEIYKQRGDKTNYYKEVFAAFVCDDVDIDTKMKILIDIHSKSSKLTDKDFELVNILIKQYPTDSKPYAILGDFYLKAEDELKGLAAYKNALKFDQSKYPIWNQVLLLEYQNAQYDSLFQSSLKCLEYFPNVTTIYLFHGTAGNQIHNYEAALTILQAGKDLVTNDNALLSEFYGQIGEAYFGLNKNQEGEENYDKALALDKGSTLIMNNYAYRLALAKIQLDKAEQMIKTANDLSPGQPHFIDTYGWVLFQKGKYETSYEFFKRAYQINPNDKIIVEHMGDGAIKNGEKEKALEYWKRALQMGATNKNLKQKIEKAIYFDPIY